MDELFRRSITYLKNYFLFIVSFIKSKKAGMCITLWINDVQILLRRVVLFVEFCDQTFFTVQAKTFPSWTEHVTTCNNHVCI